MPTYDITSRNPILVKDGQFLRYDEKGIPYYQELNSNEQEQEFRKERKDWGEDHPLIPFLEEFKLFLLSMDVYQNGGKKDISSRFGSNTVSVDIESGTRIFFTSIISEELDGTEARDFIRIKTLGKQYDDFKNIKSFPKNYTIYLEAVKNENDNYQIKQYLPLRNLDFYEAVVDNDRVYTFLGRKLKTSLFNNEVIRTETIISPISILHNDYEMFLSKHEDKTEIKKNAKTLEILHIQGKQYRSVSHFAYPNAFESDVDRNMLRSINKVSEMREAAFEMFLGKSLRDGRLEMSSSYKTNLVRFMDEALAEKFSNPILKQELLRTSGKYLVYIPTASNNDNLLVNNYLGLVQTKSDVDKNMMIKKYIYQGYKSINVKVIERKYVMDEMGKYVKRKIERYEKRIVESNVLGMKLMELRKRLSLEDKFAAEEKRKKYLKSLSKNLFILYNYFSLLARINYRKIDIGYDIKTNNPGNSDIMEAYQELINDLKEDEKQSLVLQNADVDVSSQFNVQPTNYVIDEDQLSDEQTYPWYGIQSEHKMYNMYLEKCMDIADTYDIRRSFVATKHPDLIDKIDIVLPSSESLKRIILSKIYLIFYSAISIHQDKREIKDSILVKRYDLEDIKFPEISKPKTADERHQELLNVHKNLLMKAGKDQIISIMVPNPPQRSDKVEDVDLSQAITFDESHIFGNDYTCNFLLFEQYPSVSHYIVANMCIPKRLWKLRTDKNNHYIRELISEDIFKNFPMRTEDVLYKNEWKEEITDLKVNEMDAENRNKEIEKRKAERIDKILTAVKDITEFKKELLERRKALFNAYIKYYTAIGIYEKFLPKDRTVSWIGNTEIYTISSDLTRKLLQLDDNIVYALSYNRYETEEYRLYVENLLRKMHTIVKRESYMDNMKRNIDMLQKDIEDKDTSHDISNIFNVLWNDDRY